jgi:CubicO group peptidase (beta-lactamase class C family)
MSKAKARAFALVAVSLIATTQAPAATPLPNAPSPEAQGFSADRLKRLDGAMDQAIATGMVGGALTLLARHGKVVEYRSYGDAAPGRAMARDTIFRIYSMSKPVTGVAMMILFEEGKWKLDEPVSTYIPEFTDLQVVTGLDAAGKPILAPASHAPTMRELMSHTGGFGYGMTQEAGDTLLAASGARDAKGLAQFVQRIAATPLLYQPGTRWQYSYSVDIQGYLVEKLSGMPFGQFLRQRIFTPLGMTDTGFAVPAAKLGRLASVYFNDPATGRLAPGAPPGRALPDPTQAPGFESGGGGLFSTLDDYARFAQMLANKGALDGVRILSPAAIELMHTNVVPLAVLGDPDRQFYKIFNPNIGFGLDVQVTIKPRAAGRLQGAGTFSWEGAAGTWSWVDPPNDVIFVGMIQNFLRAGPAGFDPITRPLVYQALVDPAK